VRVKMRKKPLGELKSGKRKNGTDKQGREPL
jgi:hypothetical protein